MSVAPGCTVSTPSVTLTEMSAAGITSRVAVAEAAVSWSLVADAEVTSDSMATGASAVSV